MWFLLLGEGVSIMVDDGGEEMSIAGRGAPANFASRREVRGVVPAGSIVTKEVEHYNYLLLT